MKTRIKKSKSEKTLLILLRIFIVSAFISMLLPGFSVIENQTLFGLSLKFCFYGIAALFLVIGVLFSALHGVVKANRLEKEAKLNFFILQSESLTEFANRMHYDGENALPKEGFDQSKITPALLTFEARRVSLEVAKAALESEVPLKFIEERLSSYKN